MLRQGGSRIRARALSAAVALVVLIATVSLALGVLAATGDITPAGESCYLWLADAPLLGLEGQEEIRWGLISERICGHERYPSTGTLDHLTVMGVALLAAFPATLIGRRTYRRLSPPAMVQPERKHSTPSESRE